jgi:hypothetical protein
MKAFSYYKQLIKPQPIRRVRLRNLHHLSFSASTQVKRSRQDLVAYEFQCDDLWLMEGSIRQRQLDFTVRFSPQASWIGRCFSV